jgi:hypothetical protein
MTKLITYLSCHAAANLREGKIVHCLAKDGHPRAPVARRLRTGRVPGALVDSWTQGASLVPDKKPSQNPG